MSDIIYKIYKHTCIITGKSYIGYTFRLMIIRWKQEITHSRNVKNKRKLDVILQEFPDENLWIHGILIDNIPTLKEAYQKEIEMIALYDTYYNGYNENPGGGGVGKHSEETRKKMSKSSKGKKKPLFTAEHKKHMSDSQKGKKPSLETRKKMSKSHKGLDNHQTGRKHTDESKKKIREARNKQIPPNKGKKLSEEWKRNLSENHVGMLGKFHSEETKVKMRHPHKKKLKDSI
jgi:group I intron endonuclease